MRSVGTSSAQARPGCSLEVKLERLPLGVARWPKAINGAGILYRDLKENPNLDFHFTA
jgi:hypothetical protein